MPDFMKGMKLAECFYIEAVQPLVQEIFPGLAHSAARLDHGSDVLEFDTERSMDHDWGPRIQLFLSPEDNACVGSELDQVLRDRLPVEVRGFSTNFSPQEIDGGWMVPVPSGPINHGVAIQTLEEFAGPYLNVLPDRDLTAEDWLIMPAQCLRTVAAGKVLHDGLGTVQPLRKRLRYYPDDVWRYLLAAQWRRISQEEAFVGRTGHVEDEIESRIIAARLVRDIMGLAFLMERTYPPYIKWFGTAFQQLRCAGDLAPLLHRVLEGRNWHDREEALSETYSLVARLHNAFGITEAQHAEVSSFHSRPYKVIHAENFSDAIMETIESDTVRALIPHLGSVDQFVDSTDVLSSSEQCQKIRMMYH